MKHPLLFLFSRYLYCDEIPLEPDNVLPTIYAAKKYIIPHLERACVEYLEANVDASNACLLLSHSRLFEEPELTERCWNFIDSQTEKALESGSFTNVDYATLKHILRRDTLCTDETVVFEAAIRWAKTECTRQGRDTSPQQCREVLGKALYLLRFPTMTADDFAEKVGKSGLLNMQETNDLLFYYIEKEKSKVPFPTARRTGIPCPTGCDTELFRVIRRCRRFPHLNQTLEWNYSGEACDSIQFSVDKAISLLGFGVYGSKGARATYQVTIELKFQGVQLRKRCHPLSCDGSNKTFPVHFDRPFRIAANKYYTASLSLRDTQSGHAGEKGMSCVDSNGITFNFKKSHESSNGTNVNCGQIPEILYRL